MKRVLRRLLADIARSERFVRSRRDSAAVEQIGDRGKRKYEVGPPPVDRSVGHDAGVGTLRILDDRRATRGRDGAVMVAPDGRALSAAADAEGRYPVGSGDAFLAGLVVARVPELREPLATLRARTGRG